MSEKEPYELWNEAPDSTEVDSWLPYLPNRAGELCWTIHFGERVIDQTRPPQLEHVNMVLQDPSPNRWHKNSMVLSREVDGVDIKVLVSFDGVFRPTLVTAYPTVTDLWDAEHSDTWDAREIRHAHASTVLQREDPLDNQWKEIELKEPLKDVRGHDITTLLGASYARCVNCGKSFNGKGQMIQSSCV